MTSNFISASNHTESYLTASTIDSFLDRAKALGLSHFSVTDQGFLGSVLKTYQLAKKKDIKVIAGMEIYFKDSNCDILRGTESDKCKFFQLFVHCLDQKAYQVLIKLASKDRPIPLTLNEQEYPLFDWSDLEELSKYNVTIATSGVNCLVGKQFLLGRGDLGLKIVNKLINMFGYENLYLSIIPNKYTHYWDSIVTTTLGYDKIEMTADQQIWTNYRGISKASDLARPNTKHFLVKGIFINKTLFPVNKKVYGKTTIKNSFTELPNDLQRMVNKYFDAISKKTGCRLLLNSYSFFANDGDKIVQDMKLGDEDRIYQSYHVQSGEEARNYLIESLNYTEEKVDSIINNNLEWANRFNDFELKYEYRLVDYGDNPEKILMDRIKSKGRMKWDNPIYIDQMNREIDILVNNGVKNLVPYFLPIEEMIEHYSKNMQLVNVGRGSSAGFLLSYLLGITQIDPIRYGLSSERFITLDRIRNSGLPDIDMDFNSRSLLVGEDGNGGFLNSKYGKKVAQVSTRTLLRLKSAILDANRFTNGGETEDSIVAFSKSLPSAPQGISDSDFIFGYENSDGEHVEGILEKSEELQEYALARPQEWSIVQKAVSLVRQRSRHASAFCIADVNIDEIVPTMQIGEVKKVTQYEAKQCETAGLIKYDFLCIKVLDDIQGAINLINKKAGIVETEAGYFHHEGKRTYIWDIPEDPNVFLDMQKGNTETVFQFNTTSVTPFLMKMKPNSLMDLSATTALIRPGPLGFISPETGRNMADEFVERKFGRSVGKIDILNSMFPETHGILCLAENTHVKTKDNYKPIQDVQIGELVQTENGEYHKVLDNIYKGISNTVRIRTNNSEELIVTPDHKVLTNRGWVEAKDLTNRDLIKHFWASDEKIEEGTDIDWCLGLMLADADLRGTTVSIACQTEEFANKVKEIFNNTFEFMDSKVYFNTRCWYATMACKKGTKVLGSNKGPIRTWLEELGIYKKDSYTKFIPIPITKKLIEGFIEGDGGLGNNRIRIKNSRMARQIFVGLQRLKIRSNLFLDEDGVDNLSFDPDNLEFKIKTKIDRTSKGLFYPKDLVIGSLPRNDGDRQYFYPKRKKDTPFISRYTLEKISIRWGLNIDFTQTWSKVESVKKGPTTKLYDLSVENVHSFVAGGNVVHNCYQEQISEVAKKIGLMTIEDSENVRVAMGKKKMKELESMKPQFLKGAITKVDELTANTIWEMMVEFAKYSFNFSHSLSYSYTGYACAFLKYHYRLEWFASVISEADSVEINEVLYKHIRNILTPPDINLSEESMIIDYEAGKIRSKLSILNGISDNLSSKIQAGRPYLDIKDFLKKKICGDTMTKKLVHIGVMDSILPAGLNLEEKIKLVNQAFIDVAYEEKIAKGIKAKKPKAAFCDPDYLMLSHLKDFQMKKAVYPTMNLELDSIMKEGTTAMSSGDILMVGGKDYKIRNSEYLSENENKIMDKNTDFAIAGYVLELGYFTYSNDTKKACKMTIDSSGYVSEKVIWPNKETGILTIPDGLEKGAIAWFCYTKRAKKVYTNIDKVYIEKYSIISRKKVDKISKEE